MAHSTLHVAIGMAVGTAIALPPLARAWARREPMAAHFARGFAVSYAVGAFAVVPAILRNLGVPNAVCDGWWMNVFLLYPWINTVKPGAITSGPLVLGAMLGGQYLLLVAALIRARRRRCAHNESPDCSGHSSAH